MTRTPHWRLRGSAIFAAFSISITTILTTAMAPLGPLGATVASAQSAVQGPLAVADLGPDWMMADERMFTPPEGGPSLYLAAFQRPPNAGLDGAGPVLVTLRVDLLPEAPPQDAVDQNLAAFLAASNPPSDALQTFDQPTVGSNAMWYTISNVNLNPPDQSDLPPGVIYGVIFVAGNNVVNLTTLGFPDHYTMADAEAIARVVASRASSFSATA